MIKNLYKIFMLNIPLHTLTYTAKLTVRTLLQRRCFRCNNILAVPPYWVQCIYLSVDAIFQNLWFLSYADRATDHGQATGKLYHNLYKIFMLNIPFTHLRFESKGIHFYRSYLPDDGKTAVLNLVRKGQFSHKLQIF
jgi:hypothetical protein